MDQPAFADLEDQGKKRNTRRVLCLHTVDVPCFGCNRSVAIFGARRTCVVIDSHEIPSFLPVAIGVPIPGAPEHLVAGDTVVVRIFPFDVYRIVTLERDAQSCGLWRKRSILSQYGARVAGTYSKYECQAEYTQHGKVSYETIGNFREYHHTCHKDESLARETRSPADAPSGRPQAGGIGVPPNIDIYRQIM